MNLVGVAKGVNVMVDVAVGKGVPGVIVGETVLVGDAVYVRMDGRATRVPGCGVVLPSSIIMDATVLKDVAVGRTFGVVCVGNRSHAESVSVIDTIDIKETTKKARQRSLCPPTSWPSEGNLFIRQNYNISDCGCAIISTISYTLHGSV